MTPSKIIKGDLVVKNGIISKIKSNYSGNFDREINCEGLTILPGLIDTHVHFRDPGLTEKEDFTTGTTAAASGGVTTVFDMPNTIPPTTSAKSMKEKKAIAASKAKINYNFFAGVTASNVTELNQIRNIPGIKLFVGSSTGNLLVNKQADLEIIFQNTQHLLAIHAEQEELIRSNQQKFQLQDSPEIHSQIRSREAEIQAVQNLLELAKKYKTRIHFCHISTRETVALLEKYNLSNVTAEVSMHHLLLNESAYAELGNFAKVNPPLRTAKDNKALWQGLKKGIIQTIATDHAPHLKSEKEQDYWSAPSGMPMIELTLSLLLNEAYQNNITLEEIARWTSENPAQIFGIKNKGQISVGYDADLVVVDRTKPNKIENKNLFTKCKWSAFDGKTLTGKVEYTIINGQIVFEKDMIVEGVFGQEVQIKPVIANQCHPST